MSPTLVSVIPLRLSLPCDNLIFTCLYYYAWSWDLSSPRPYPYVCLLSLGFPDKHCIIQNPVGLFYISVQPSCRKLPLHSWVIGTVPHMNKSCNTYLLKRFKCNLSASKYTLFGSNAYIRNQEGLASSYKNLPK